MGGRYPCVLYTGVHHSWHLTSRDTNPDQNAMERIETAVGPPY